jgi:predicted deacylase
MLWIIFLLILSIILYYFYQYYYVQSTQSPLPKIYKYSITEYPVILIISGTHGDEPGPSYYLDYLTQNNNFIKTFNPKIGTYYIVPYVNPEAIQQNVRNLWWKHDINRSYPNKTNINRFLLPIIDKANLILDFHEAYNFHLCDSRSVGQTFFTDSVQLYPILQKLVNKLNQYYQIKNCQQWSIRNTNPILPGCLRQYTQEKKIPYVLIEIPGHNIQSISKRMKVTEQILKEILKY